MIASEPAIQDTSVPMISGVKAGNILLGDTVVDKPILAALEYLNSLDEETFKNIAEVNIGDPGCDNGIYCFRCTDSDQDGV